MVLSNHRVPRVRPVLHVDPRLTDRARAVERGDLGPRLHHLAELAVAEGEHVVEDPALVVREALMAGDDVAELLLAHLLAGLVRVAAEEAHDHVRRGGEQPDHRPHEVREAVEHGRDAVREAGVPLDSEPLGRELAEHERKVGDHQREQQRRDRGREAGLQAPRLEQRDDRRRDRRGAVRGRREAGDGHADLHRREEGVGVAGERGDLLAAAAAGGEGVELALAEGDERHLGGGEHAADEDEHHDQDDVEEEVAVHERVPVERVPVRRAAVRRMARRVRGVPGVVRAPGLWLSGAGSRAVLCMDRG